MSPATRKWLYKAIGSRIKWKESKRMTWLEFELTDYISREDENLCDHIEMPKKLRIKNQDYNNFRRKFLTRTA